MSDMEQKSPFIHVRAHISEMDTQKQLGHLKRSLEITFGNIETVKIMDKDDLASSIKSSTIADRLWDEWEAITEKFESKGYKFIKAKKEESGSTSETLGGSQSD